MWAGEVMRNPLISLHQLCLLCPIAIFTCYCLNIKNLLWAQGRRNTKSQQIYGHQPIMFHQVLGSAFNRKLSVSYLD